MSQHDLFSPPPADETEIARAGIAQARATLAATERDRGMAQVEENAPPGWIDEALAFVERYLTDHVELFSDDLWDAGLPEPPQRKALGPVVKKAAAMGWMVQSGSFRPSVSSHGQPKPVWRSLLYRGATT